ncbi:MAG: heavy-metal-associated domain-containing protein [Defluviitaleaceae bacterium]|nr:heavy-metal-associated domain-containing protein [Defluviitaleaceae bacterium]
MKKIVFVLFAVLIFLAACGENNAVTSQTEGATTTELTVWGMVCQSCITTVERAVSDVDGVISVSANFRANTVTIIHDDTVDINEIEKIIEQEGFNLP